MLEKVFEVVVFFPSIKIPSCTKRGILDFCEASTSVAFNGVNGQH